MAAGNLIITRASRSRGCVLVLGEKYPRRPGRFSWRERNSQYIIKGTTSAGGKLWDSQPASMVGVASTSSKTRKLTVTARAFWSMKTV
ncbi:hypothetical protein [Escherichia coli]|uniref:hypothetical protein n=1 Tax=Escherichia coli TaxID=562 RepID=UPI003B27C54C